MKTLVASIVSWMVLTCRRTPLEALSALMAFALVGCASGGARSDDLADKGILVEKRYAASVARVDSAAARALVDLGYTIVRDSGDGSRYVQTAPTAMWDDCVKDEMRAASQHPIVQVFVVTNREGDSTESSVGAHTLRRVPDVVVGGKRTNAHLIVKMCAVISVTARMDTLLAATEPIPPVVVATGDTAEAISVAELTAYDHLVSRMRSGDTLVDYTAARMAYTKTPKYQPYPVRWEGNQAMFAALERRKYAEVRRLADSILITNYVDADAHLGAMAAAFSLGDSARGQFHGAVYRGLIRSIGARSGRSLDSAVIVIALQEEYALLRARGLERTTVAMFQCGRSLCEQMEVIERRSRTKSILYFDISIPQAWGAKHLR